MGRPSLRYAVASRPFPGESANGDQWIVQPRPGGLRIAVIDGLGHGREAEAAAIAAVDALRDRPDLDPAEALLLCDRATRHTRGAAASVVCIAGSQALFAGVGNVEGRILDRDASDRRCSPDRGVLGRGIRPPRVLEFALNKDWTIFIHTDGISSRFETAELGGVSSLDELARSVLMKSARITDDATVVVVRDEPTGPPVL